MNQDRPARLEPTAQIETDYRRVPLELQPGPPVIQPGTEYILAPQDTPRARPRVVIVGAGFGGLSAARALANQDVDVLLIDRNNYHGFWPLLYQVATAGLEPEAIAYPVRAIVRQYHNIDFQMADVTGVDFERRLVLTSDHAIAYDYLILAAGSANNYFGNDALAQQTYGMKDIHEAERLRNHVLTTFERAHRERDPERRRALLTFAIVGGGPTGVELAGAFAELIRHVLHNDYHKSDLSDARVILVEATGHILATFPERLQRAAQRQLTKMGVEVLLNTAVATVDTNMVTFKDGGQLAAGTVVWAAGVRAALLTDALPVERGRGGRVQVTPALHLPGRPEVFVVGDMAYLPGYHGTSMPYPMVAPVAMQQGRLAAQNILAARHQCALRSFQYAERGQMATIGRQSAVVDAFGLRLEGFIAWVGWLFVHLLQLIGFRNRLVVIANWAHNYFTYDRGIRVITRPH